MLGVMLRRACVQKQHHVLSSFLKETFVCASSCKVSTNNSTLFGGTSRNGHIQTSSSLHRFSAHLPSTSCYNHQTTRNWGSKSLPEQDPVKGTLVYVGTISGQVKAVKTFSLSTSIIAIGLQPLLYSKAVSSTLPVIVKFVLGSFFNFFIFLTPVLLHFLSKRYVTSMYYNEATGKFTATRINFFVRSVETTFTRDDVESAASGMLTTMTVNKKPFFFDPEMFLNQQVFMHMMKYDEPMDVSFKPGEYAGKIQIDKIDKEKD